MNAEQFHDALTLLSPDLVAEADELRQRPKVPVRWKPLAALAACFLLVLGLGRLRIFAPGYSSAAPETAMRMAEATASEGAAAAKDAASGSLEEEVMLDTARRFWEAVTVATPDPPLSAVNRSGQPVLTLLTQEEDWTTYESAATQEPDALAEAVDVHRLTEEDLLLICLPAQTATVTDVNPTDRGLQICLSAPAESTGSTIALWLPKGMVASVEEITLLWEAE